MANRIDVRDLQALRRFLGYLKTYNDTLRGENAAMRGLLHELKHVWPDPQYEKLAAAFEEMDRGVQSYLRQAEAPELYLARYIEKLAEAGDIQL